MRLFRFLSQLERFVSSDYYHRHAEELAARYQKVSARAVHGAWLPLLESELRAFPHQILDVGAGSGRDAAFLAALHCGHRVVAVEPCQALASLGAVYTADLPVEWRQGFLPELAGVEGPFSLILLSAVWMHLSPELRPHALARLRELLSPDGLLVISLRLVISEEEQRERAMFAVSAAELSQQAAAQGLAVLFSSAIMEDVMQRPELAWQTLILGGPRARLG